MPQEVDAEGSRTGSGGASGEVERGASARGGPGTRAKAQEPEREGGLAGELERARAALAAKDLQVEEMARELAGKDQQVEQMARELEALRREVRGVEVHDVEAGVSRVEERGEEEPPPRREPAGLRSQNLRSSCQNAGGCAKPSSSNPP